MLLQRRLVALAAVAILRLAVVALIGLSALRPQHTAQPYRVGSLAHHANGD